MRNNFLLFSLVMKPVNITILGLLPCLPHKEHLLLGNATMIIVLGGVVCNILIIS